MGRKSKGQAARKQGPAASPQQSWEQALAAYQQNQPQRAQRLLASLLDLTEVPGEVVLVAGLVENQLGNPAAAELYLHRALRSVPERLEGWLGLGSAQHMQGRFAAAASTFKQILQRAPDNPTALYNLGMAYMDEGRHREALDAFERALELYPDWIAAERQRAILLGHLRWSQMTRSAYEALLEKTPEDARLQLEFAEFLEQNNQSAEAAARLPPPEVFDADSRGRAWVESLRARFQEREGDHAGALERVAAARRDTGHDFLGFREGALLDRLGRPDEAMAAFSRANAARSEHSDFRRLREQKYLEYLENKIERGIPARDGPSANAEEAEARPAPVFVVGLPRSGTTLIDRMLGAHPGMQVLEEFESLRAAESVLAKGQSPAQARAAYWNYVDRHIERTDDRVVVDKNPLHVAHLDNLPTLFPDARVILMLRHPFDAALSCYMQDFAPNPASVHFLELESTARFSARLLAMMRAFEQACPDRAIRLHYEDLVEDFPGKVTGVLHAVGMDWHDAIGAYASRTASTGMVATPSYEQVTQGLYRSAMGRWRQYEQWLAPFRENLGQWLPEFGYTD